MHKIFTLSILSFILLFSCKSKPASLPDQLKENFLSHLRKIDSTVALDSFIVLRIDSIDQRHERAIDDSVYMREFRVVQAQLSNAVMAKKTDSIGFYEDEVDYMEKQADSLSKEISNADTIKILGLVARCKIQLSKHAKIEERTIRYFLDMNMKITNSEMIDPAIATIARKLN
jgi:hypothetical protein